MAVSDWTIVSLAEALRAKNVSAVEATQAYLDRIARLDPRIRSFITVDGDGALAAARTLDAEAAAGRWRGPLHGVPLAYKDLCHIHGLPTSCGTKTAEYFTGPHECTAVTRLRAAGAITLGKLNMSELALGPFGDNARVLQVACPPCGCRAGHSHRRRGDDQGASSHRSSIFVAGPAQTSSTRRLRALPDNVSLVSMGRCSPKPAVVSHA